MFTNKISGTLSRNPSNVNFCQNMKDRLATIGVSRKSSWRQSTQFFLYLLSKSCDLALCKMLFLFQRLQTYQWSERVIRTFKRKNWLVRSGFVEREVHMIVTPHVVDEVRRFFNCSELEGAELEDQGEEGTALTHWEKRVFEVIEKLVLKMPKTFSILRSRT